jgi:hypothetical protein
MNTPTFRVYGQLQHHFHGDYWATLVLAPAAEDLDARHRFVRMLAHLIEKVQPQQTSIGRVGIVCRGTSDQLEPLEKWLEDRRVDAPCNLFDCKRKHRKVRHELGSTAHSIDHGPQFEVELPCVDLLTPLLPFTASERTDP